VLEELGIPSGGVQHVAECANRPLRVLLGASLPDELVQRRLVDVVPLHDPSIGVPDGRTRRQTCR
jgi:hypothetical protein